MLTVYGIETHIIMEDSFCCFLVATVLTVYGIETVTPRFKGAEAGYVATVLTVYGIETEIFFKTNTTIYEGCNSAYRLRY